jgi:FlgD Ig-like domain
MRPNALPALLGPLLVLVASLALAYSTGAPPSVTGAPAVGGVSAEGTCSNCHSGGAAATFQILDLPDYYVPDSVYVIRVRMTNGASGPTRGGFQLTAVRKSDGQGAGTFDISGLFGMKVILGTGAYSSRQYVQHTGQVYSPGSLEWQFRWRAPGSDDGRMYFFSSGVNSNGNGSTSLDGAVLARDSVESFAVLGASERTSGPVDLLQPATPNPSRGSTSMGYSLTRAADVELAVFDAGGRRVRTLLSGWQQAGTGRVTWDGHRDDGAAAGPGVYWAQLRAYGSRPLPAQRITLTR